AVAFGFCATAQAPAPDTILVNGHVVTVDASFSIAQAVAGRPGRLSPARAAPRIRPVAVATTMNIYLPGQTVAPPPRPRRRPPPARGARPGRRSVAPAFDFRRTGRDLRPREAKPARRRHRQQQRLARGAAERAPAAVPQRARHRLARPARRPRARRTRVH